MITFEFTAVSQDMGELYFVKRDGKTVAIMTAFECGFYYPDEWREYHDHIDHQAELYVHAH